MLKAGYPYGFSAGLTASGSLMSTVMPPSIPAVLFAATIDLDRRPVRGLDHPGHAHGGRTGRLHLHLGAAPPRCRGEPAVRRIDARQGGGAVIGPALLPVIILGGIFSGLFTPTESAGIAAVYMLLLGAIYRTLTWRVFWKSAKETVVISAGILLILGASNLMGQVLAREQVSRTLGEWLTGFTDNPIVFLLMLNVLLILLGIPRGSAGDPGARADPHADHRPVRDRSGAARRHHDPQPDDRIADATGRCRAVRRLDHSQAHGELFRGILPFLIPLGVVLLLLTLFPVIVTSLPTLLGLMWK